MDDTKNDWVQVHCVGCNQSLWITRIGETVCRCGVTHTLVASSD